MNRLNRLLCGATALAAGFALAPIAVAESPSALGVTLTQPGDSNATTRTVLSLDKSTIVELDRPAADVVITNPTIADAVVQTSQRIIFRGVKVGQTNAFIFDSHGKQILNLEIRVEHDLADLDALIKRYVPGARVTVEAVNEGIVINGVVDSVSQSDQVLKLVSAFAGGGDSGGGAAAAGGVNLGGGGDSSPNIVNMMSISAKDQVMLEVRIVEMQRNVVKQLGINLSGVNGIGDLSALVVQELFDPVTGLPVVDAFGNAVEGLAPGGPFDFGFDVSSSNGYNVNGASLGGLNVNTGYTNYNGQALQSSAGVAIDALERIGVVRTLAEPNITAVSGESAKFLAGGEFPVPVGQDQNGRVTIEFKPFGVGLGFTPFVLSEGRISLKVSTEVSELTSQGAYQGQTVAGVDAQGNVITAETITIPALSVRRAESTVELPSGGSMMMAGLIQSRTRQTLDQLPGIKKLPVLGALFQSRDFVNEETELVVIVTPYLVDPTQKNQLRTPADGYANATDPKTIFFGKLNAQYGKDGAQVDAAEYKAPVGFIEE